MTTILDGKNLEAVADRGRFATLLSPSGCPRPAYDQVVLDGDDWVVAPTLGSILPNWLLLVPRKGAVTFAQWRQDTGKEPDKIVDGILARLGARPSRSIWFEHGPAIRGSAVGCGVDYAHIHLLIDAPFSFDKFTAAVKTACTLNWRETTPSMAYRSISANRSYLIGSSTRRSILAEGVEDVGSQFFRRVIAGLVGRPDSWNYRTHPYTENVEKTLEAFGDQMV